MLVNCLNFLAWEDSTVDGLLAQEVEVALVGLLNSREDMRIIVPAGGVAILWTLYGSRYQGP